MSITRQSTALVQHYAPELEERGPPHLKATNDSWRVDETYIKVKKVWMYLYRAVDSQGNTLEFLLSPTRSAQAAKRFFSRALAAPQIRLISLTLTNARPFSIIYLLHRSQIAYHASILWQQLSSVHYQDFQKNVISHLFSQAQTATTPCKTIVSRFCKTKRTMTAPMVPRCGPSRISASLKSTHNW